MMVKWIREKPKGWIPKLIINTIGAIISFIVTIDVLFNQISTGLASLGFFTDHCFMFSPN